MGDSVVVQDKISVVVQRRKVRERQNVFSEGSTLLPKLRFRGANCNFHSCSLEQCMQYETSAYLICTQQKLYWDFPQTESDTFDINVFTRVLHMLHALCLLYLCIHVCCVTCMFLGCTNNPGRYPPGPLIHVKPTFLEPEGGQELPQCQSEMSQKCNSRQYPPRSLGLPFRIKLTILEPKQSRMVPA